MTNIKPAKRKQQDAARGRQETRPMAATRDVVSPIPGKAKINPKWDSNYRHLAELRDHFQRHKGTLTQDVHEEMPTYSEHMADAGTDSYDRDFALGMLTSDSN